MMDFFNREQLERLPATTLFKWIFLGAVVLCLPYQFLLGVLAMLGYETVEWRGRSLTGLSGLIVAPLIGLFAAGLLTLFLGTGCVAARWVFSRLGSGEEPEELPENRSGEP